MIRGIDHYPCHVYWKTRSYDPDHHVGKPAGAEYPVCGRTDFSWLRERNKIEMKKKASAKTFGVIGLGRFGMALAMTLAKGEKDVICY